MSTFQPSSFFLYIDRVIKINSQPDLDKKLKLVKLQRGKYRLKIKENLGHTNKYVDLCNIQDVFTRENQDVSPYIGLYTEGTNSDWVKAKLCSRKEVTWVKKNFNFIDPRGFSSPKIPDGFPDDPDSYYKLINYDSVTRAIIVEKVDLFNKHIHIFETQSFREDLARNYAGVSGSLLGATASYFSSEFIDLYGASVYNSIIDSTSNLQAGSSENKLLYSTAIVVGAVSSTFGVGKVVNSVIALGLLAAILENRQSVDTQPSGVDTFLSMVFVGASAIGVGAVGLAISGSCGLVTEEKEKSKYVLAAIISGVAAASFSSDVKKIALFSFMSALFLRGCYASGVERAASRAGATVGLISGTMLMETFGSRQTAVVAVGLGNIIGTLFARAAYNQRILSPISTDFFKKTIDKEVNRFYQELKNDTMENR